MKNKALIAMSGGVDSSLAAKLMQEQGYDCIGCNMRLYFNCMRDSDALSLVTEGAGGKEEASFGDGILDPADGAYVKTDKSCCSAKDAEDARLIAKRLGIPFTVFDLSLEFRKRVIDKFVKSYEKGITPNPCIDCNRYLKFGVLLEWAKKEGCSVLASGHYARVEKDDEGRFVLKKALDGRKDQSYVLYMLTEEQLSYIRFPLGNLTKERVRELAAEYGFENAEKKESQDICFVPDGDYAKVIRENTGRDYPPGDFKDLSGNVLGRHRGIINYTIGQRKGLNIAFGEPKYVCRLIPEKNEVVLASDAELFEKTAVAEDFNWINGIPSYEVRCKAKIRYRQKEQWAVAYPLGEGRVRIEFDEPQRAISPGQAAVLYDGDVVLGGGTIVAGP